MDASYAAHVILATLLILGSLYLTIWGLSSLVNKIRKSRLDQMPAEPVPMPSIKEMEHLSFEQAKDNFKLTGQQVSDTIDEVKSNGLFNGNEVDYKALAQSDLEFEQFAKELAEKNKPGFYDQIAPDIEHDFSDEKELEPYPDINALAEEYSRLPQEDFNRHLQAMCTVLKWFPREDDYLKDPFYFQFQQMMKQQEAQQAPVDSKVLAIVNTMGVSDETVAKVREQFNSAYESKRPKRRQAKRSAAFEAAISKPIKKGRARSKRK